MKIILFYFFLEGGGSGRVGGRVGGVEGRCERRIEIL